MVSRQHQHHSIGAKLFSAGERCKRNGGGSVAAFRLEQIPGLRSIRNGFENVACKKNVVAISHHHAAFCATCLTPLNGLLQQ